MPVIDGYIVSAETPYDWGTEVWRTGAVNFFGTVAGYYRLRNGLVMITIEGLSGNIHHCPANSPDLRRTRKQSDLCFSK